MRSSAWLIDEVNMIGTIETLYQMFFVVSKLLGFFALPSNDVLAVGIIGLALMPTRSARTGRALVSASIILFLAFGLLPLGKVLIEPLEARFPPWEASSDRAGTCSRKARLRA